jgi:hypothetical protein
MGRFSIFSGETVIGHLDLAGHDPGMAIAWGRFEPTKEYEVLAGPMLRLAREMTAREEGTATDDTREALHRGQRDALRLTARTASGEVISTVVYVDDYSDLADDDGREVTAHILEGALTRVFKESGSS